MSRKTTITGKGIRDETVDSVDIASGSIKAGELSAQSISGQATITSTDTTNDRLLIFDATDSALKQISIGNLGVSASPAGSDGQIQYNNGGATGGAANFYWSDSNNRLGIGTSTPEAALEIKHATSAVMQFSADNFRKYSIGSDGYGFIIHDETTSDVNGYRFVISDQTDYLGYVGIGAGASIAAGLHPNALLHLSSSDDGPILRTDTTTGDTVLFVTGSGFVGVGTRTPRNVLDVYGNISNDYVALIDNDAGSNSHGLKVTTDGTGTGTTILDIEAGSTTVFKVRGDGRVGIGVATPGSTLSVDDEIAVGEKLIHRGDPDTYLQFPSNDNITFAAGGSEELKIASDAILVKQYIKHEGDEDTYIMFDADELHLAAGGRTFLKLEESTTDKLIVNHGALDIDLQVKGENSANLIRTDAANDKVGINTKDPTALLHVSSSDDGVIFKAETSYSVAALLVSGSGHIGINTSTTPEVLTINGIESNSDETLIQFTEDGGNRAKIGINTSNNVLIENQYTNKHIVLKVNDNGVTREAIRCNGAVAEVVVNEGSEALVDFRVESDSNTHMLYVDGGNNTVGINTSTPGSTLEVAGSVSFPTGALRTGAYTITEADFCTVADCNSSAFTLTLPSATDAMAGRIYTIKRMDSGNSGGGNMLTISRNGKNIDNVAGDLALANLDAVVLQCIGASGGWIRIGSFLAPI